MLTLSILLAALSSPQNETPVPADPGSADPVSFVRLEDDGRDVVSLAFESTAGLELGLRSRQGPQSVSLALPLPGGESVALELRPVDALAPGARARVVAADGTLSWATPSVACFSGHVVGGGSAFLALSPTALNGYLSSGGELYYLASEPGGAGRASLTRASALGALDHGPCGVDDQPLPPWVEASGDTTERLGTPLLREADVFIEADPDFRARFASDQDCVDYTALLLTAASEIYRRDVGVRLVIPDGYLRVWNTTPPWGPITGFADLKDVYTWWQSDLNPLRALPRAAVHVLTSPVFGGTSRGVDGLCNNVRAYEISSVHGRFPYPRLHTDRYNWDLFVVCHELGHTFGSPHSDLYTPPIECADGSGPDSGTIMSYCHLDYGIAQVGMRFHQREQRRIRDVMNQGCMRTQTLVLGDYDGNGLVDRTDWTALEEVLAQGFRSIAAEEVFDMDQNGVLDDADRALMSDLVFTVPPAVVNVRNGSGINPSCLEALGRPLLGATWSIRVHAPGIGTSTLLVAYDLPLAGVPTPRGELLVRTTYFGGTKLYSSSGVSDGTWAMHDIPLPRDPVLFGLEVHFQALIVDGPQGDRYCNALDALLSPY